MRFTKKQGRWLFTLALLSAFLFTAALALGWFYWRSRIESGPKTQLEAEFSSEPISSLGLAYASFTDLFSGTGWLDQNKTTLWHDRKTSRLVFPLNYEWNELAEFSAALKDVRLSSFAKGPKNWLVGGANGEIFLLDTAARSIRRVVFVETGGFYLDALEASGDEWVLAGRKGSDGRVWRIKIDDYGNAFQLSQFAFSLDDSAKPVNISCRLRYCLLQQGLVLRLWDGVSADNVELPPFQGKLQSISIANLKSSWVVGVSKKIDERFSSRLFRFNGFDFKAVVSEDVVSDYPGVWGFGSNRGQQQTDTPNYAESWLAVYGAYQGIALEFQNDSFRNVSQHVPIRVMEPSGFAPSIIPLTINNLQPTTGGWVVYSREQPRLLKIESGVAADLSGVLPGFNAAERVLFAGGEEEHELLAAVSNIEGIKIFRFKNLGFDKTREREVVSSKLNTQPGKITAASITELTSGTEGGDIAFYLSPNGGANWELAVPGQRVVFPKEALRPFRQGSGQGSDLRWKAVFKPANDAHATAWLGKIRIDFLLDNR